MKIIILSKGRPQEISTHTLFKGHDYKLVLHNEEERAEYLKNPTIDPSKIVVSRVPFGVAIQRQWIQEYLVQKDEWYLSLDDNIKGFTCVPKPRYSEPHLPVHFAPQQMRRLYDTPASTERFLEVCREMAAYGERIRAFNCGFGTTPNFFFRGRKWRYVGYVISKAVVRKNVGTPFEMHAQTMEDYAYTAETLLRYGKVLINNYAFPIGGHYEKGGIGTYEERLPSKIRDAQYLIEKYPFLFRHPNKKGADPRGELAVRFNSLEQVEKWRIAMRIRLSPTAH